MSQHPQHYAPRPPVPFPATVPVRRRQERRRKVELGIGGRTVLPAQEIFRVLHYVYAYCFQYRVPAYRLSVVPIESGRFQLCVCALLCLALHLTFRVVRFVQVSLRSNSLEDLLEDTIWLSGFGITLILNSHLVLRRWQVARLVNMFIMFQERVQRLDWGQRTEIRGKSCYTVSNGLRLIRLLYLGLVLTQASIFFGAPHSSRYIYSVLTQMLWQDSYGVIFLICGLFEFLMALASVSGLIFATVICCTYAYCSSSCLRAISQESGPKIRKLYMREKAYLTYRRLQLLNAEFNAVFAGLILPSFIFSFVVLTTFVCIAILKFHGAITLSHTLLFGSYAAVSLVGIAKTVPLGGNIFAYSVHFVSFWNLQRNGPYHKAFLRSCVPLKIWIGPFLYFQRATALQAIAFIIYFSMRVVLTL